MQALAFELRRFGGNDVLKDILARVFSWMRLEALSDFPTREKPPFIPGEVLWKSR